MNIALFGYAHPFGQRGYYGAERVIWYLANGLIQQGHQVTIFSVPGCDLPGCRYVVMPPMWSDTVDLYRQALLKDEAETGQRFDVVHSYMASGLIDPAWADDPRYYHEAFFRAPDFARARLGNRLVSHSKLTYKLNGSQGRVVYYGLPDPVDVEPVVPREPYLAWLGRMDHGKAPDLAIQVAKQAGIKLVLMGPAYHPWYFQDKVWPHVDQDRVVWLRAVSDKLKYRVLKGAMGFLSTNGRGYAELFGLVNLEALACGTPVIGWCCTKEPSALNYAGGELFQHGVQGFVNEYPDFSDASEAQSIDQAVGFVRRLKELAPSAPRQLYLDRFTVSHMVGGHLAAWSGS